MAERTSTPNDDRRETLLERFREVRGRSLRLREPLSAEDCAAQSMLLASPAKWHLAHTSWFFETFILEASEPQHRPFHPEYRVLFNSYYNSVGIQYSRPDRGLLTRPSLSEVLRYREHVDDATCRLLEGPIGTDERLLDVLELGLHHEEQHQELLLTDVKHLLSRNPLHPTYRELPESPQQDVKLMAWSGHEGGVCEIGHAGDSFHFDNEGPRHEVLLQPFELATRLVTNGEYLAFLRDDGYRRPELWLSDGWETVDREGWEAPLYWERTDPASESDGDDDWQVLTLAGLRALRADEPVCHISYYEADAYARWAAARLPIEAEWERVASLAPVEGNLLDDDWLHPTPAPSDRGDEPVQLFGDVWEWTASPYSSYPGYRAPEGALGEYNGKFMCNQLVLRGGSCVTPRAHVRASYRNFFPADARWQFSGLRLARDGS